MVYRILVVEDEEIVRRSLVKTLDEYGKERFAVFQASDGLQGIASAKAHLPDILMTDIKMPRLDGLSMIAGMKEFLPHLKCLILSGYDDFDFAREAIELKVSSYLLKPFDDRELFEKIDGLLAELDELSAGAGQVQECDQIENDQDLNLVRILLDQEEQVARAGGISDPFSDFREKAFRCCAIQAIGLKSTDKMHFLSASREYFMKSMPGVQVILGFPTEDDQTMAMICGSKMPVVYKLWRDLLTEYGAHMHQRFHVQTLIGSNAQAVQVESLPASWTEACKAMEQAFFTGVGPVVYVEYGHNENRYLKMRHKVYLYLTQLYSQINAAFFKHDPGKLEQYLEQMKHVLCNNQEMGMKQAVAECERMLSLFFSEVTERSGQDYGLVEQQIQQSKSAAGSLDQVFGIMLNAMKDIERNMPQQGAGDSEIILAVKNLIKESYSSGVTLAEIADVLGLSPNYLGTLFVRCTDQSFNAYLTQYRIDQARYLLEATRLNIQQIARQIGLGDVTYFSTLFKKTTGLTPSGYRKLGQR